MIGVYVIRWGPAYGDDYSCQVFTRREDMLKFIKHILDCNAKVAHDRADPHYRQFRGEAYDELNFEVHRVKTNAMPDIPKGEDQEGLSDLICIGQFPDTVIWRSGTEEHKG